MALLADIGGICPRADAIMLPKDCRLRCCQPLADGSSADFTNNAVRPLVFNVAGADHGDLADAAAPHKLRGLDQKWRRAALRARLDDPLRALRGFHHLFMVIERFYLKAWGNRIAEYSINAGRPSFPSAEGSRAALQ